MGRVREKLSYANVMATIAVFLALGGAAYAITLKRNSVGSRQLKPGAVKLKDTSKQLRLKCPRGTGYYEGACIEIASRTGSDVNKRVSYQQAVAMCRAAGRRLPSVAELEGFRIEPGVTLSPFGEVTSDISLETGLLATTVPESGSAALDDAGDPNKGFRCVAEPRR